MYLSTTDFSPYNLKLGSKQNSPQLTNFSHKFPWRYQGGHIQLTRTKTSIR